TAASGMTLPYKIECDRLRKSDLECIASIMHPYLNPYGKVVGVPRGGLALAEIFDRYKTRGSKNLLVVDDVWTTGGSMRKVVDQYMDKKRNGRPIYYDWQGVVIFARAHTPIRVRCFAMMML